MFESIRHIIFHNDTNPSDARKFQMAICRLSSQKSRKLKNPIESSTTSHKKKGYVRKCYECFEIVNKQKASI